MTIEQIKKKYPADFNTYYSDFKGMKTLNGSLLKKDFEAMFEIDTCYYDLYHVFDENLFSYSDNFITDINNFFCEYRINKLVAENENLKRHIANLRVVVNEVTQWM